MSKEPFWKTIPMQAMSQSQWESLCDRCGRCCLHKLEDEDSGEIAFTNVVCKYMDTEKCSCTQYPKRNELVEECIFLTPDLARDLSWLPNTCAYRVLSEEGDLPWWHPLVSGDPNSVHEAGISVRGKTVSEEDVPLVEWEDHIIDWIECQGGFTDKS